MNGEKPIYEKVEEAVYDGKKIKITKKLLRNLIREIKEESGLDINDVVLLVFEGVYIALAELMAKSIADLER